MRISFLADSPPISSATCPEEMWKRFLNIPKRVSSNCVSCNEINKNTRILNLVSWANLLGEAARTEPHNHHLHVTHGCPPPPRPPGSPPRALRNHEKPRGTRLIRQCDCGSSGAALTVHAPVRRGWFPLADVCLAMRASTTRSPGSTVRSTWGRTRCGGNAGSARATSTRTTESACAP
jgi:hypothetical protein